MPVKACVRGLVVFILAVKDDLGLSGNLPSNTIFFTYLPFNKFLLRSLRIHLSCENNNNEKIDSFTILAGRRLI